LGLERILLIMEERGMFPAQLAGQPQVLVTQFDESTVDASLRLTHQLRAAGLRVDLYPDLDRYGRQFKYADERKIRYALLTGPEEILQKVVAIKDLVSGEQISVAIEQVALWLQQHL
jgi:histidyl-tRNA synthetase